MKVVDETAETVAISGADLEAPVQFVDAYLYEGRVYREKVIDGDPSAGTQLTPRIIGHELTDGGHELKVVLKVEVAFMFREAARAVIEADVIGHFRSQSIIEPDGAKSWATREALMLMWPYARAIVSQLAGAMHVSFPPLPTLDVVRTLAEIKQAQEIAQKKRRARTRKAPKED